MERGAALAGLEIVARSGLADREIEAARALTEICNRHEALELPLSLASPREAPHVRATQLLAYLDGALVGFLALEDGEGVEVCGMVQPEHRRRGIARGLLEVARQTRGPEQAPWHLVCEDASPSGRAFVEALGARHRFSEHRMRFDASKQLRIDIPRASVELRRVEPADLDRFTRLVAESFGEPAEQLQARYARWMCEPTQRLYLAELDGEPVGTMRLGQFGSRVFLTSFGVSPAQRKRRLGREILRATLALLLDEGQREILIEVRSENAAALALYRSSGFREERTYGFYELAP